MPSIRPFRPGDEPALAEICRKTADSGGDATGILDDDEIWAAVFVLPYVARHPDLAFVVEADDGRVIGYVVGTDDTRAFEEWFATRWWPGYASRWPNPGEGTTRQHGVLAYAYAAGRARSRSGSSIRRTCTSISCPRRRGRGGGGGSSRPSSRSCGAAACPGCTWPPVPAMRERSPSTPGWASCVSPRPPTPSRSGCPSDREVVTAARPRVPRVRVAE